MTGPPAKARTSEGDRGRPAARDADDLAMRIGQSLDFVLNEIFVFDAATFTVLLVNNAACHNLGYDRDEFARMPIWQILPQLSEAQIPELVGPLRRGECDRLVVDTVLRRKNGTVYPVEVHLGLETSQTPPVLVANVLDITERRRAEAELEVSRRRLSDFLSASADWLWETDADHRFTFFSKNMELVTGQSVESEYGRRRDENRHDDDAEAWDEHLRTLAAHEPFRDFVYRRAPLGKGPIWVRTSGVPIVDATGQFHGYRGVASNITRIKEAELAAQRQESRFRDLIDASIQGIYVHRDWKLLFANSAMARMLGYDSVDALMQVDVIDSFFSPADLPGLHAIADARMAGEDIPAVCAVTYRRRDGTTFATEHVAKVLDWQGAPAVLATVADIQDRKRYEDEIQQARERAEAASQAKSNFLALMSHELRTPLNAILGFSQIIKDGVLGPIGNDAYLEYARDIYDSGNHLLHIISEILDISKIETGHEALDEDSIGLDALIAGTLRLIEPLARDSGVSLTGPPEQPGVSLLADVTKLKQILINLVSNAVKFTPICGQIDVATEIDPSGNAIVRVTDTGVGIKPEDIETVLAPFGQIEGAAPRAHAGIGLGLPIAKKLLELHGGGLVLTSTPNVGTCVTITLPASRVERTLARVRRDAVVV